MKMLSFTVADPAGMHARPAAILSKEAVKYQAEISLQSNGKSGNMKSILGIMSMGIKSGQSVDISIAGPDEGDAYEAISALVSSEGLA